MESDVYLINKSEELVEKIYSDLIYRYEEPPIEKVMPLLLFRKIVEKINAIKILNDNNCGEPALSLSRTLLENYWSFRFILEEDSKFKSLSYYYFDKKESATKQLGQLTHFSNQMSNFKKEKEESIRVLEGEIGLFKNMKNKCLVNRNIAEVISSDESENSQSQGRFSRLEKFVEVYDKRIEEHNKNIEKNKLKVRTIECEINSIKETISEINKTKKIHRENLSRLNREPLFSEVRSEIQKVKKKKAWYTLKTGITSIYKLAETLELESEYRSYAFLSQEIHSLNASNQISVVDGNIVLTDSNEGGEVAKSIGMTYLSYSIKPLLEFYDREELYEEIEKQMSSYYK